MLRGSSAMTCSREVKATLPSATLAEEILLDGPGRVRALISCGGNPLAAFPDHEQTFRALRHLDLLVQVDPFMSQTADLADYVIAPKMTLVSRSAAIGASAPRVWAHSTRP